MAQRIFDDWLESTAWLDRLRDAPSLEAVFDGYRSLTTGWDGAGPILEARYVAAR